MEAEKRKAEENNDAVKQAKKRKTAPNDYDSSLSAIQTRLDGIGNDIKKLTVEIEEKREKMAVMNAAHAILRFMKAHSTGLTAVIDAQDVSTFHDLIRLWFEKSPSDARCKEITDILLEYTSADRVADLLSSVIIYPNGRGSIFERDERATCYEDGRRYTGKFTCKKENYICLSVTRGYNLWLAVTNRRS